MENQKAKYDILLEQMQLPESIKNTPLLKSGQLKQVLVHTESRKWTFQLLFAEILPIDLYQIFLQNLTLAFQQIATVELQIEATNHAYDGTQLVEYWQFINENQPFATPFIQQVVKDCIPTVANDQVTIKVANESAISLVMQQYFPTLAQLFQQAGFPKLRFVAEFDQTQALQDLEAHEERKKNQQEIFMKQAAEAVALHEQRAKAAEKDGPAYDGPIALGRAIPKEELITPMGNILEEERRITIEGYIFDKEVRELRSKRKILILKITDYTSSFIVKKFSSGEKDEQIFDAIQTGKWLKVRGSIQEDTFMRDLVMNAQDLVEVTHAQRVDRAPENQKRVELHLHSNMSQMDATNKVGDFVAQAAKWGHKAIAITDHGGAQSFPDAHQAAKKAGIKMIYGVEANIVDDGVQVAYNPKPTPLADATYVVFDVETTGLSAVYDTIIELAAVKMHKGNVEASFDEFIDPGHPLSNTTINLTGITDEMVRGSKSEEEVLRLFREFSEGEILVAHNDSFDMVFL
ncbi:MAG: exonuclease domain-containing protein, partial [Enterococcus italicus]